MSIINNGLLLAAEAAAAPPVTGISRSLRFNSADSAYLSRTPASAGNRKTWTWAGWMKRARLGSTQVITNSYTGDSDSSYGSIQFLGSDSLRFGAYNTVWRDTTAVLRDPSAWYHIVVALDTTQAVANDRVKMYVNGTVIIDFATLNNPSLNADLAFNQAGAHNIGNAFLSAGHFDGYLADIHFIDGQALDPSSFGEFDTNNVWQPTAYTGTYGTNGFHLTFSDNSGTSSTTLGKDAAGSNNWTPNNFSVAAGSGNDSLVDVPTASGTDTGAGGEVRGNYCTWNPLNKGANMVLLNGNLDIATTTGTSAVTGTIGVSSGKWYWETTITGANDRTAIGIAKAGMNLTDMPGDVDALGWGYFADGGTKHHNATSTAYGDSFANGDTVAAALDLDAGTLTFYKNGVSQGIAFTGLSGEFFPATGDGSGVNNANSSTNFGQRPFAYTAPSGFKALCTTNLPEPTIADGSTAMDVKLYTGNGSTQTISGLNFSPDLVWIKARNDLHNHRVFDTVRPLNGALYTNATNAEVTSTVNDNFVSFNLDGFSLGATSGTNGSNQNGDSLVAWTWDAGSSTVTNNDGSISSQVRANPSAGFSVVTYTGNGVNGATVGHGLGVAPSLIICKVRNTSDNWCVYHASIGASLRLNLNTTAGTTSGTAAWGTAPTSTVFSIGTSGEVNTNGNTYVAYCFAPVAGYSSFGSYTGNGSADGPFVYTGFRPRWVMIKCSSATFDWRIFDTLRSDSSGANVVNYKLYPNTSAAENGSGGDNANTNNIDILSNGFKLRTANGATNDPQTYIYAAFSEVAFNFARGR